jgi:hypothetical protein
LQRERKFFGRFNDFDGNDFRMKFEDRNGSRANEGLAKRFDRPRFEINLILSEIGQNYQLSNFNERSAKCFLIEIERIDLCLIRFGERE